MGNDTYRFPFITSISTKRLYGPYHLERCTKGLNYGKLGV
jgi:hypothetical protein